LSHRRKLVYTLVSLSLDTHLHCVICIVSVSTDTVARVSQLSQIHIPAISLIYLFSLIERVWITYASLYVIHFVISIVEPALTKAHLAIFDF
jgi:hypothetical protein